MEVTREFCESYATEVMALGEPDRLRKLWEMCEVALAEDAPGFPIIVGLVLRDRRIFDWAEYVFQLSMRVPGARGAALFELSVLQSHVGRPDRAVLTLEQLESEQPINAYGQRVFAHCLTRIGEYEAAERRLDAAFELEPARLQETLAFREFGRYIAKFPAKEALRRAMALTEVYPLRTHQEVADDVMAALAEKRPYALMRLNDGEGVFHYLSIADESEFSNLYNYMRRDLHRTIFGREDLLFDGGWLSAMRRYNSVIANADCLGAHHYYGLEGEYAWGSLRNVPGLFNIVRLLEELQRSGTVRPGQIAMCSPQVNQEFLFNGHLERILRTQTRLGLISCHSALPGALAKKFGFEEVVFHKTPGEALVREGANQEPFDSWHGRITAELADARPGLLYLVGAGVVGKIYCDMIKKAGGVVLDIGAVADVWMKATATREWDRDVGALALTP